MKVDFQHNDTQIDSCMSSTAASTLSLTAVTTTGMYEKPDNNDKNNCNDNDTVIIVPFERHRQEEVVTLFQKGLLSYDFSGNGAWKLVNEWFVADRLSKEMKDVYTGFNMATSKQKQAAAHDTADEAGQNEKVYASFEGLHFMTAIDSTTDKVVGCVGIKRPDQHTLAVLQQQNAEQSDIISRETTTTTCELVRLSVDATCQRRGIGKMLVQAVEDFAKRNGYRRVCLTTLKVLYQSCGYSVVQEEALDYVPALPQEYLSGNKIMSLVYLCKQLD
jgi:GNAT superfamily N-acetyltransferase